MSAIAEDFVIPADQLVPVLLVEDTPTNASAMREDFEQWGFRVEVAANPDEARARWRNERFGLLISDQIFDGTTTRGDEFLLEEQFSETPRALVTAWGIESIDRKDDLDVNAIPVIEKGPHTSSQLKEIAQEALLEMKQRLAMSLESRHKPKADLSDQALCHVRQMLIEWLRARDDSSASNIYYGGDTYCPDELANEVEASSEVGEEHLLMFIKVLRKAMHL